MKCCQILGSVAGSLEASKLQVFAHAYAVSALSNKDRFRFEPISVFVYICEIDQSHYVI